MTPNLTPGTYSSAKLGDRSVLQIKDNGQAAVLTARYGVSYEHPILDLATWLTAYGPVEPIEPETPTEPDPEPVPAAKPAKKAKPAEPVPTPQTAEETAA